MLTTTKVPKPESRPYLPAPAKLSNLSQVTACRIWALIRCPRSCTYWRLACIPRSLFKFTPQGSNTAYLNRDTHRGHRASHSDDTIYEMVQTYGVAEATDVDPSTGGDEARALLGGDSATVRKAEGKPDGHATIVSCISNLSNTIIGSGARYLFCTRPAIETYLLCFVGMLTFPMVLTACPSH